MGGFREGGGELGMEAGLINFCMSLCLSCWRQLLLRYGIYNKYIFFNAQSTTDVILVLSELFLDGEAFLVYKIALQQLNNNNNNHNVHVYGA